MYWRYQAFDALPALVRILFRIFRQLLLFSDGLVDPALENLDALGKRYRLWRRDFGIEDFRRLLLESGEAREGGGGLGLTKKGERALRQQALHEVFQKLTRRGAGDHRIPQAGGGGEPLEETRAWEFGDDAQAIDPGATLGNWARRTGGEGVVREEDLEVRDREHGTSCATVLLIDISHSMTLYGEDRITPAKRVALALAELTLTRFPKDSLDVVLFGDDAFAVPLEKLPYLTNGPYHTNTRAGLMLAQRILARKKGMNRQIVMITDGKPSAIHEEGRLYKNPFGLDRKIVARTLEEAVRCRRKEIPITTFMLTAEPQLQQFVERFTALNRGRAFFSQSSRLDSFLLVDFLRRSQARRARL